MKIEFIIPTYERTDLLMTSISSIVSQSNPNWKIHVIADGPSEEAKERLSRIMEYYNNDDRIKWTILKERYNDWGHTPRNIGLDKATEEWVVMTGEDNYYVPFFCEAFLSSVKDKPNVNFVYCNMVHNWMNNDYIPLRSEPRKNFIDIGNFMSKAENSKQLKLEITKIDADGYFVEDYLKRFPNEIIHIDKILYVHN